MEEEGTFSERKEGGESRQVHLSEGVERECQVLEEELCCALGASAALGISRFGVEHEAVAVPDAAAEAVNWGFGSWALHRLPGSSKGISFCCDNSSAAVHIILLVTLLMEFYLFFFKHPVQSHWENKVIL